MTAAAIGPGSTVERYVVDDHLGQGGVGTVYKVHHRTLGTEHALKLLHASSPSLRRRLLLEGQVQAQIRHPHIVAVTDVLEAGGLPGLVMEYVHGPTLAQLLATRPLALEEADGLAEGIFAGVEAIHAHGLVHRDLKPANILLQETEGAFVPKVADFGLAKVLDQVAGATRTNMTMGTPGYMPPEQIRDVASVGPAADVYALGAILYEMLTGMPAFERGNVLDTFKAVDSGDYTPVRDRRTDVPERMARAVGAALRTNPAKRPATVAELRALWRAETRPPSPGPVAVGLTTDQRHLLRARRRVETTVPVPASEPAPPNETLLPPLPRPRRLRWAALAVLPLLGAAGLALRPAAPAPVALGFAAEIPVAPLGELAGDAPRTVEAAVQLAPRRPRPAPVTPEAAAEPEPMVEPPPEPPVEPPPAPTTRVTVHGAAHSVWLRSAAGMFRPGEVAPGTYRVSIVGPTLEPVDAGSVTVGHGEHATLRCHRLEGRCERIP